MSDGGSVIFGNRVDNLESACCRALVLAKQDLGEALMRMRFGTRLGCVVCESPIADDGLRWFDFSSSKALIRVVQSAGSGCQPGTDRIALS